MATTVNTFKRQKRIFHKGIVELFCCSHLLFLHNNLHNKLCLILLLLISVTKLPQILAGTASKPILLMVWKKNHIFSWVSYIISCPLSFTISCLEAWQPCRSLFYNIPLTVTATNYNAKSPRTLLLQLTNLSQKRRILLNFTESVGQIMRNGMKEEQFEYLHEFSIPPLSVWATFGLQKWLYHFLCYLLLENMPEYGTTQISLLLPKYQVHGPTVTCCCCCWSWFLQGVDPQLLVP